MILFFVVPLRKIVFVLMRRSRFSSKGSSGLLETKENIRELCDERSIGFDPSGACSCAGLL